MRTIYQPIVIEKTEVLLDVLEDSNFFSDYEEVSKDFARCYLLDRMTEKFISGNIDNEDIFNEDEFTRILSEIISGSLLLEMKKKGIVDSIEDEHNREVYFLTKNGKDLLF